MKPLFNGTLFFVQVQFTVANLNNKVISVSTADINTAIGYATKAAVPISLYASQYGANSINVSQNIIPYKMNLKDASIDDSTLRSSVNDISSNLPKNSCVVVMLPPEIDNTSSSRKDGTGGYHDCSNVPYINSYINNDKEGSKQLSVEDKTFRYAGALSHEIGEMVVNPRVDGNPEVCDPCGPNLVSTYLDYFDSNGNYITTTQTPPYEVKFNYGFYINGIVQPAFAKPQAAPPSACSYSPVPVGVSSLAQLPNSICCDAFFSKDDNFRHAIIGLRTGEINEVFFNPKKGQGTALLTKQADLLDVGAFYSDDDHFRHVIFLTKSGTVSELAYNPQKGSTHSVLGTIKNATHVCGFYSSDDNFRHAIVAASDGTISEIFFHPAHGIGQAVLGKFPNIVDLGCFYSSDDNYRHVIIGTKDNNVTEFFYNPKKGKGQSFIGNFNNLSHVSCFYVDKDLYSRRIHISTTDGDLNEIRFSPAAGKIKFRLVNVGLVNDIGAFYSSDDNTRHSILLYPTGVVKEVFYSI
jgi:hypothetical protein